MFKQKFNTKHSEGWDESKARAKKRLMTKESHREVQKLKTISKLYGQEALLQEDELDLFLEIAQ